MFLRRSLILQPLPWILSGRAMSHAEIQPGAAAAGQSSPLKAQLEKSQQSWWWMLLLVLLLGIFEMFLANRTYR